MFKCIPLFSLHKKCVCIKVNCLLEITKCCKLHHVLYFTLSYNFPNHLLIPGFAGTPCLMHLSLVNNAPISTMADIGNKVFGGHSSHVHSH